LNLIAFYDAASNTWEALHGAGDASRVLESMDAAGVKKHGSLKDIAAEFQAGAYTRSS
jgi:hypothetical protein